MLGRLLGPLLKPGLSLVRNVLKQLAKRTLIPSELTATASVTDAAVHKKMFGSGNTTLIIWNEKMNDISWRIWITSKRHYETIKNEAKEQKGRFLGMLLGT